MLIYFSVFQTSESCIKLHAVVVLELLLSEQFHCSRCVCVCVSTAPGVCALGWVKYREHISLLVILCIIVCDKKTRFFPKPIMVKCWNIGKPIYQSISNYNGITTFTELLNFTGKICLFFINKELYFFSQLLKYYMLHGLIYSFLRIWDFKNKWEMRWMFHFIQVILASS